MMNSMLLLIVKASNVAVDVGGKAATKIASDANSVTNKTPYQQASEEFKNGTNESLFSNEWIMIVGGVVLFVFGLIGFIQWWRSRHDRSQPLTVFYRVGRQAGLRKRELWLLRMIAKYTGLPTPLALMMSSGTLIVHAGVYIEARAVSKPDAVMDKVEQIATKLFDGYVKGQHGEGGCQEVKLDDEKVIEGHEALAEALKMVG